MMRLFSGFLLFNKSVQDHGAVWNQCQVRNHWHRIGDGYNDSDFHSLDGPFRQENSALVRFRWHVHFLNFHHHFILGEGKSSSSASTTNLIQISYFEQELVAWIWWLSVVSTLFYVVFFAVGPGSIPWMITAELFSQGPRPAAMSVAVLVNWSANFFVGIGFPTMQTTLENYTFLPFSVFLALFWVFTYRKVPETKNKTFDEIATLFRIGHKQRYVVHA